ncbi:MAG: hypothetical protein NZ898_03020 [Myxococcota bacterium]|nr:hypothetical protein [Myxococcota bacterium]MDW8360996.1 MerR family transcriptional regulator [Myxococcales bacterium]
MLTGIRSDFSDEELDEIRRRHPNGLTAKQVVDLLASRGDRLTEATFRKYVQLGLLPRSTRVAKDRSRGSQGLYPASVVRHLVHLRRLMAQGFTLDDVAERGLLVHADIDALERQIERVLRTAERATERTTDASTRSLVEEARSLGTALIGVLLRLEERIFVDARMARAAV